MEDYEPSPAARLIETRRLAQGVSMRKAAAAAELSEGRWRQIAKGYQQAARGMRVPVNTTPETLARMAAAVNVEPDEMERAGHPDVADLLRAMSAPRDDPPTSLSEVSDEELLREVARRMARAGQRVGGEHGSAPKSRAGVSPAPPGVTKGGTRSFDEQPPPEATTRSDRARPQSGPA